MTGSAPRTRMEPREISARDDAILLELRVDDDRGAADGDEADAVQLDLAASDGSPSGLPLTVEARRSPSGRLHGAGGETALRLDKPKTTFSWQARGGPSRFVTRVTEARRNLGEAGAGALPDPERAPRTELPPLAATAVTLTVRSPGMRRRATRTGVFLPH